MPFPFHLHTLALLLFLGVTSADNRQQGSKPGVWIPDNGDGTYTNPIIFADYSDPDVIRVGDDYFLTSSSFSHFPGLPILHSKDLVSWKLIGHAVPRHPYEAFEQPQHGNGIWAPSLRYHNNEFYIFYGDPDYGIFMTKAVNPKGPWDPLVRVKEAKGWIDPCPLWDDDGKAYLVHAWAKSRAGFNSVLTVNRMSRDGRTLLDSGVTVFDGRRSHPTIEGPKLYKRNGYYYVFAPAGGVKSGWQTVLRSKNITGPYEGKIVLEQGSTDINGPHQGAWVETQTGESWFFHFQDLDAYGRVLHLQPMRWSNGWPLIGEDFDKNGIGEPVRKHRKPIVGGNFPIEVPQTSDDFDSKKQGLQWQWQGNPNPAWISLEGRNGWLRFFSQPSRAESLHLWNETSLLLQKFPAPEFSATTKLEFLPETVGEKAGLIVFGLDYSYVGVEKKSDGLVLSHVICRDADKNRPEVTTTVSEVRGNAFYFRVTVRTGARCRFSYSTDGTSYQPIGKEFSARPGKWVGAKLGMFSLAPHGVFRSGYTDFDWIRIHP